MIETSSSEIKEFRERCLYWIDKLHLHSWDIFIGVSEQKDVDAWSTYSYPSRQASILIARNRVGKKSIEHLALRECLAILMTDIASMLCMYSSQDITMNSINEVINILLPILKRDSESEDVW